MSNMRRPRIEWHQEILDSEVLENLDHAAADYDELLIELAERHPCPKEGETPEHIAKQIGYWVTEEDATESDFSTPISDDIEGEEGRKMALGYIGVKAFEFADKGTVPEI
jgi:hypothetical protein